MGRQSGLPGGSQPGHFRIVDAIASQVCAQLPLASFAFARLPGLPFLTRHLDLVFLTKRCQAFPQRKEPARPERVGPLDQSEVGAPRLIKNGRGT